MEYDDDEQSNIIYYIKNGQAVLFFVNSIIYLQEKCHFHKTTN
jgi:hypothetical protein